MAVKLNILGALTAVFFFITTMLVFISRLAGKPQYGYWLGYSQFILTLPLIFLLCYAPRLNRPVLYYIQIGLMLAWLILEIFLDYICKIEFRQTRWLIIVYVTLFFAGSGGMIGVSTLAGRGWTIVSVILFLIMAVLAFVQRSVTGM